MRRQPYRLRTLSVIVLPLFVFELASTVQEPALTWWVVFKGVFESLQILFWILVLSGVIRPAA